MSQSLKRMLQTPRAVVGFGAAIVAVATWYAIQSHQMSGLLFVVFMLSSGIANFFGEMAQSVVPVVMVLVAVLLFLVPALRLRVTVGEHQARFTPWVALWLLVFLVALLWFGEPGQFSL
jgi:hypothetical protein